MIDFRDQLYWGAMTVLQESGGEPYRGKLAVAYVIMTRATAKRTSVIREVLRKLQFSCWNTDSDTRLMVSEYHSQDRSVMDSGTFEQCYKAMCSAYFGIEPDPTDGADHYLNPEAVRKLPSWYDQEKVTAVIGRHEFLRLAYG